MKSEDLTVAELIKYLQTLPQDLKCYTVDHEYTIAMPILPPEIITICEIKNLRTGGSDLVLEEFVYPDEEIINRFRGITLNGH